MNLREAGLGPEGQVVCWEGQQESPLSEICPPGWPSLGVWLGPPFTPARQKGRAPDGAVGQRGQQTTATAPSLSVRKNVFMGVTDGSLQAPGGCRAGSTVRLSGPQGLQGTSEHIGCNQGPTGLGSVFPRGSLSPKAVSSGSGASLSWAQLDI